MSAYTDLINLMHAAQSEIRISPPDAEGVRNVVSVLNGEATFLGTITDCHNGEAYGYEAETVSGDKSHFYDLPSSPHAAAFHTAVAHIIRANNVP